MGLYRATVDLTFPVGGGRGTNTWCFRTSGGVPDADALALAQQQLEGFYNGAMLLCPNTYEARFNGEWRTIADPEPSVVQVATGFVQPGRVGAADYSAAAAMACITWRTTLANRSGRGRTFVGPIAPTSIQNDGTLTTNARQALLDAGQALIDAFAPAGAGAFAVWSPTLQTARDFTARTVTDQVAILRSRRD